MSIELRGLVAATLAALAALGIAFGLASVIRAVQPAPPQTPRTAMNPQAALVVRGQGFYAQSCARCHGPDGQGGSGPPLQHSDLKSAQIATTIKRGVSGAMPAFGSRYNDSDTQAIVAYVRSLK